MPAPNIVLVIVHDLGRHLGCYGVETVHSPNIDALAAHGVRFAGSYCTAPQCSPSRASLFTGRYPHETGMLGLAHDQFGWDIHETETHLARSLHDAGYRTGLIGFQHETRRPCEMGYDDCDYRWHDSCENIGASAVEYIEARKNESEPYYLQIGIIEPHTPFDMYGGVPDDSKGAWVPPYLVDEPSSRAEFAAYQGAIRKMDASVGKIFEAVERSGRAEETLVIFTTDHGSPFLGAKVSLYNPGLETALVVRWPAAGWIGGRVVEGMLSNVDLHATLCEVAGARIPSGAHGISFADLKPKRELLFGEMTYHSYYDPMRCVTDGSYKLIANFSSALSLHHGSRKSSRPVAPRNPNAPHPDFELFDLAADPHELSNAWGVPESSDAQDRLLRELARWMVSTDDLLVTNAPLSPQHARVRSALLAAMGWE